MIDAGGGVAAAPVVDVQPVAVIVVGVQVVVDVDQQRDDGGDETNVAHSADAAGEDGASAVAPFSALYRW